MQAVPKKYVPSSTKQENKDGYSQQTPYGSNWTNQQQHQGV
jgi:hypothetical protein